MSKSVPYLDLAIPMILGSGGKKISLGFKSGIKIEGFAVSINLKEVTVTMEVDGKEQTKTLEGLESVTVHQPKE